MLRIFVAQFLKKYKNAEARWKDSQFVQKKACNYFIYDDQAGKSSERKRKRIGVEKISFYKIILAPALPIFLVSLGYITKFLVSRPLKIEKVMRTCVFYYYFLSFLQGQIEIFETRIILHFPYFMLKAVKCISIIGLDRKIG